MASSRCQTPPACKADGSQPTQRSQRKSETGDQGTVEKKGLDCGCSSWATCECDYAPEIPTEEDSPSRFALGCGCTSWAECDCEDTPPSTPREAKAPLEPPQPLSIPYPPVIPPTIERAFTMPVRQAPRPKLEARNWDVAPSYSEQAEIAMRAKTCCTMVQQVGFNSLGQPLQPVPKEALYPQHFCCPKPMFNMYRPEGVRLVDSSDTESERSFASSSNIYPTNSSFMSWYDPCTC